MLKHKYSFRRKGEYYISTFYCSICGKYMFIPRPYSKKRKIGHIKDMYCYNCRRKRKFIEKGG